MKSDMGFGMAASDRIGQRLKLQDLRLFVTVVETGSMGRAARRLNTSQPNISRAIADLEHTLRVQLLDRHRQGVAPTEYGRALLDCGLAVFDDLEQGVKKIEYLADPTGGELRIGSPPPIAASYVAAVIDRLSRRYPRMVFDLMAAETAPLYRLLGERSLDLLVARHFGAPADRRLNFEILYRDSYVVAAGALSPWARRRRIALADLAKEPWVLPPPDSVIGAAATELFQAGGVDFPAVTVITVPQEVRASLAATGHFLTIFPTTAIRFFSKRPEIKVLSVELQAAPAPVAIVTIKNRQLSPIAQRFIEQARDLAKPLAI
jgi:DNA-binding transcriptional LysR family regulator